LVVTVHAQFTQNALYHQWFSQQIKTYYAQQYFTGEYGTRNFTNTELAEDDNKNEKYTVQQLSHNHISTTFFLFYFKVSAKITIGKQKNNKK
jgi:hypothetical protein